jgi:glutathione peroxidase-family protein
MMETCATSCELEAKQALKEAKELQGINSFFDLSAKDIIGDLVEFSKFEGQVTILVNVASYCGYTDSHYKSLVQLWSQVRHTGQINILAFPCNQFGAQEPETNENILEFAHGYHVDFTMMDKIDVNGANASLVYKYLKAKAGPANIAWNFATYFVVAPDGTIESHSGIEPLELKDAALGLLESDEL